MIRIAVVGAGLAGLTFASRLAPHASVTLFEKSRGVGGRMATRYDGAFEFDHGAQFFTARSGVFRRFLAPLIEAGAVRIWHAGFVEIEDARISASRAWDSAHPHYVAVPRMNTLGKTLAMGLDVRLGATIVDITRAGKVWQLTADTGSGRIEAGQFDWVVLTAPAPQTAAMAPPGSDLVRHAKTVEMLPCYALMAGVAAAPATGWQAARVKRSPVSWVSVNSSKPGRPTATSLVIHSTNAWAAAHLQTDAARVTEQLLDAASALLPVDLAAAKIQLHRWRFANVGKQDGPTHYLDHEIGLAACGDWFIRGRVEAAFRSASDLAGKVLKTL